MYFMPKEFIQRHDNINRSINFKLTKRFYCEHLSTHQLPLNAQVCRQKNLTMLYIMSFSLRVHVHVYTACILPRYISDPCHAANTSEPFEPDFRAENCQYLNYDGRQLCDRYITPGWYRFAQDMLNHPPMLLSCAAVYPSWLNGKN